MDQPVGKAYFERRAKEGYGLQFPDGHVIRLYQHVLKDYFSSIESPKLFDFGCWNGTHAAYFADQGWSVSGADIVAAAVQQANERLPDADIRTIDDQADLPAMFGANFDMIFTNQVLYFLDDDTLAKRLTEFRSMLKPGGLFYASMLSRKCFYSRQSVGTLPNGLEEIRFVEPPRFVGKTTFVRFVDDVDHLKAVFRDFEPVHIGRYECDLDGDHSTEHLMFVGRSA